MIFSFFRRNQNSQIVDQLHGEVMAAARQPYFFTHLGVADTLEGRFECLALLSTPLIKTLAAYPEPGPQLAQDLTDAIFAHLDIALRETGVSDIGIPKKMKKMAQSYLGRASAYRAALAEPDDIALQAAIARNVYGGEGEFSGPMSQYVRACTLDLAKQPLASYLVGQAHYPSAERFFTPGAQIHA
ncbi:MAG: ubiquinol-cytochrome c chaperone [Alphaproteobacteria bacterium]|nr:ubiquinol-cytochrome c chaperone [Alphaproteobacteria bacterium]